MAILVSGVALANSSTPLPIANGGTGQSTAQAAINALLPSQTGNTGYFLMTDGTNVSWAAGGGGGGGSVSSVFGRTGAVVATTNDYSFSQISGTATIAQGGTGHTTATSAFNALSPIATTGDLIVGTGIATAGRLPIGTTGQLLSVVSGTGSWVDQSTITVGSATTAGNIAGGATGSLPYQSAASTTTFLAAGTNGYVLTLAGGVPTWAAATASGVTSITGTTSQIIASASTGAVTLSLPQSIATSSTPTFAEVTITGSPSASTDAATKGYVDAAIAGLSWKQAAAVATTANITLSGLQTIDGYTTLANDRVLVKNQTTASLKWYWMQL